VLNFCTAAAASIHVGLPAVRYINAAGIRQRTAVEHLHEQSAGAWQRTIYAVPYSTKHFISEENDTF